MSIYGEGTLDYIALDIELKHDGCTSLLTSGNEDVKVKMLYCHPFRDRGYSWVVTESSAKYASHLVKYLKCVKRHNKVRSVLESRWNSTNKSLRVSMIEGYDGMVSSLAYELGAIHKTEVASKGTENWKITLPVINYERFMELIELYGKVLSHRATRFDIGSSWDTVASLSQKEKVIFKRAFEMGYFEYPKRAHLKDLAGATSLSIPTVNEHLRTSQKKMLKYFADLISDS